MRKLILYMHTSLDGKVQGATEWDLNWISYDPALEKHANKILRTVDTVLWGRTTFLGMQQHWTSVPENPESSAHERNHADWLDRTMKIAVSTTLDEVTWNNSRLIKSNLAEEIIKLKQQPGKDIIILGSPTLAQSLIELDLIDEYQLTINPVVLGDGQPLFQNMNQMKLQLTDSVVFDSGVLGVSYERLKS